MALVVFLLRGVRDFGNSGYSWRIWRLWCDDDGFVDGNGSKSFIIILKQLKILSLSLEATVNMTTTSDYAKAPYTLTDMQFVLFWMFFRDFGQFWRR